MNTDAVVYGTVAEVSCDDGFMFPSGNLAEAIKCETADDDAYNTKWNVTELNCQREFLRITNCLE
jgi:Sushi repeat (SCR repeat)